MAPIARCRDAENLPQLYEFLAKTRASLLFGAIIPQQRRKPRSRPAFAGLHCQACEQRTGTPAAHRQPLAADTKSLEWTEDIDRDVASHCVVARGTGEKTSHPVASVHSPAKELMNTTLETSPPVSTISVKTIATENNAD
jgi:hypothetical protein